MLPIDMKNFQFVLPDIILGNGTISELGGKIKAMGGRTVLICTDKGLAKAGVVDEVQSILENE